MHDYNVKNTADQNMDSEQWDLVLKPKSGWFEIDYKALWQYRDLIVHFVKRDFITFYKQTILGPLWYIIQPLFSTIVFTIVFGKIAKIPTDGIPPFLFYLSGNVLWIYFASSLTATSNTFISHAGIFGKVFFPRLTVPISIVIINMAQFAIQFFFFLVIYLYYYLGGAAIQPTTSIFFIPILVLQMAILGLGTGILISSFTTKYRDLVYAMNFAVQLWMYATPIVYPLSQVPEKFRLLYNLNPMVAVIETFRLAWLGVSAIQPVYIVQSWFITLILLFLGILMFSRIEKNFIDTI